VTTERAVEATPLGTVGRIAAAAVPYAAVLIGLFVLHNAWVAIGLYHAGMIAFLIRARAGPTRRFGKANGWLLAGFVVIGGSGGVLLWVLWPIISVEGARLGSWIAGLGLEGRSWIVFGFYFSTIHSVIEELYWRGYLARTGGRQTFFDVSFAGYHALVLSTLLTLPWLVVTVVVLTTAAAAWRSVAARWGGLTIPVWSHIAADVSVILAAHRIIT
jgi:hypothetical protein